MPASILCINPFDPLSALSRVWIDKAPCFPRNLVAFELHDAHGVGRLAIIGQDLETYFGKKLFRHCYELLFRGSSLALRYSSPSGPIAVICVTYSPDFAQWKCGVLPGRMITAPGG